MLLKVNRKRIIAGFILVSIITAAFNEKKETRAEIPAGEEVINVSDFGVKKNSFENASPAIKKAIEHSKRKKNIRLVLPGGRIDLWPEESFKRELYISNGTESDTVSKNRSIAFLFDGFTDITVEGNNTLVILHGKMISFALLNCSNVVFSNTRFDYERPTMSELTIRSVSPQSVETTIHPDSKYSIDSGHISFYGEGWKTNSFHTNRLQPQTGMMRYSSFAPFLKSKAVETAPFQIQFLGDFSQSDLQPGDVLSMRDPYRDNAGAFISRSKHIKLENISMQYMHGMGIVSQFTENISFTKVMVAPANGSGRTISSFADCFHFSGCKGTILIDSCFTSGSHDDPINVHGTHLKITSAPEKNKLRVQFMHHQTYGFEAFFANDSISFVDPNTLLSTGTGKVKSAKLINKREMELELSSELPVTVKVGDCVENLSWTPDVIIRNSHFERTVTRGILVTTRGKVLIENNVFFRTGMHAILIADDAASWYESGPVKDVTIRNNSFIECGYNSAPDNFVIAVSPENHAFVKGKYVHRNISIENNLFKVYDMPLLTAKSTEGLVFSNNTIEQTGLMKPLERKVMINLVACGKVTIMNNHITTAWQPQLTISNMPKTAVKTDIKRIVESLK